MIHLHVPSVPLSVNAVYGKGRGGARFLTPEGKTYKLETTNHLIRAYPTQLKLFTRNKPYGLLVHFTFGTHSVLLNNGFPEKTENRYKKNDAGNRLKLFEDALADATGVDDSHNWLITLSKGVGKKDSTHVWAWSLEDERNPINNVLETLLSAAELEQD